MARRKLSAAQAWEIINGLWPVGVDSMPAQEFRTMLEESGNGDLLDQMRSMKNRGLFHGTVTLNADGSTTHTFVKGAPVNAS